MNTSSPAHGDWAEKIPDDAAFNDVSRRLTEELQRAATNLVVHLNSTSFRIRIAGGVEQIYITVGGGRHTDEDPADHGKGIGERSEAAAAEGPQAENPSTRYPAKPVSERSHANLESSSNLEKLDLGP